MALVIQNYFNLLSNEDGDNVVPDVSSRKAPTPLAAGAKKKNKNKQKPAKKKVMTQQPANPVNVVAQDHGTAKTKTALRSSMQDNQQKEERVVETKLTLKEYEQELLEKKQALYAAWKQAVEREVGLDKDFESMMPVHKKKVDDEDDQVLAKPKKKEISQHNDKHKAVIDMKGFLKPLRRRESKKHPVAANGGFVKTEIEIETETETTVSFQDAVQFPARK
ncbi:hypothetical protein Pint_30310 [Pistacia integerrima]|uniref:Uncharacterized protein n=1 Tax=Pistacia integerrima TaxID=434235 RepID=A0ACC0X1U1_9ROSI|nr:hypothetical protein Pint_30310 [Pistacia integerrima]